MITYAKSSKSVSVDLCILTGAPLARMILYTGGNTKGAKVKIFILFWEKPIEAPTVDCASANQVWCRSWESWLVDETNHLPHLTSRNGMFSCVLKTHRTQLQDLSGIFYWNHFGLIICLVCWLNCCINWPRTRTWKFGNILQHFDKVNYHQPSTDSS